MEGAGGKVSGGSPLLPISSVPVATTGPVKAAAPDRKPKPMTHRGAMVALSYMVCAGENSVLLFCLQDCEDCFSREG